jgi:hypothetical protein
LCADTNAFEEPDPYKNTHSNADAKAEFGLTYGIGIAHPDSHADTNPNTNAITHVEALQLFDHDQVQGRTVLRSRFLE